MHTWRSNKLPLTCDIVGVSPISDKRSISVNVGVLLKSQTYKLIKTVHSPTSESVVVTIANANVVLMNHRFNVKHFKCPTSKEICRFNALITLITL